MGHRQGIFVLLVDLYRRQDLARVYVVLLVVLVHVTDRDHFRDFALTMVYFTSNQVHDNGSFPSFGREP